MQPTLTRNIPGTSGVLVQLSQVDTLKSHHIYTSKRISPSTSLSHSLSIKMQEFIPILPILKLQHRIHFSLPLFHIFKIPPHTVRNMAHIILHVFICSIN